MLMSVVPLSGEGGLWNLCLCRVNCLGLEPSENSLSGFYRPESQGLVQVGSGGLLAELSSVRPLRRVPPLPHSQGTSSGEKGDDQVCPWRGEPSQKWLPFSPGAKKARGHTPEQ